MPSKAMTDQERHPERYFTNPVGHIRDRIIIHESSDLPREGLFMSLNGFPFLAKPGVEIDLPRPVRLMLDTRIRTETVTHDDGNGRLVGQSRNIPRVTYTLVKEDVGSIPAPEVITASPPELASKPADF
jgi:hypothetical protein